MLGLVWLLALLLALVLQPGSVSPAAPTTAPTAATVGFTFERFITEYDGISTDAFGVAICINSDYMIVGDHNKNSKLGMI
jgi:hypothetical protein